MALSFHKAAIARFRAVSKMLSAFGPVWKIVEMRSFFIGNVDNQAQACFTLGQPISSTSWIGSNRSKSSISMF
jgi:hypothetical protein